MNGKRLSSLWAWLLLAIFGVPSISGEGLHLFLAKEGGCLCHTHGHSHSPSAGNSSAAQGTEFQIQIVPAPVIHDEDHCFLCHFLTQPPAACKSAIPFLAAKRAGEVKDPQDLFSAAERVLHSGRSPPSFLS